MELDIIHWLMMALGGTLGIIVAGVAWALTRLFDKADKLEQKQESTK